MQKAFQTAEVNWEQCLWEIVDSKYLLDKDISSLSGRDGQKVGELAEFINYSQNYCVPLRWGQPSHKLCPGPGATRVAGE